MANARTRARAVTISLCDMIVMCANINGMKGLNSKAVYPSYFFS